MEEQGKTDKQFKKELTEISSDSFMKEKHQKPFFQKKKTSQTFGFNNFYYSVIIIKTNTKVKLGANKKTKNPSSESITYTIKACNNK